MTALKSRPGWHPVRLREHREAHGLSLEAAGERLREVAERGGLNVAGNFQTLWSHEKGAIYPGPHYRRAYCLLYEASEPTLGFRLPLPAEAGNEDPQVPAVTASTSPETAEAAAKAIAEGLAQFSGQPTAEDTGSREALKARIVEAWRGRAAGDGTRPPTLVLVGGYAGSGKTEFARFLGDITGWTLLDKDTLTRRLTERLLTSLGADPHDRHTDVYLNEVRPLEYQSLMETANDNLNCGISTILSAPFIAELNSETWLQRLKNRCSAKGIEVSVIWVRCDIESMYEYIGFRTAPRDAWKLANWDEYAASIDADTSPPGVNFTVDNRLGAAISVADQTRAILSRILA